MDDDRNVEDLGFLDRVVPRTGKACDRVFLRLHRSAQHEERQKTTNRHAPYCSEKDPCGRSRALSRGEVLGVTHAAGDSHPGQFTPHDVEVSAGPNIFKPLYEIFGYDKRQYAPGETPRFKSDRGVCPK